MNRRKHLFKTILPVLFMLLTTSTSQLHAGTPQTATSGTESTERAAIGIRTNLLSWALLSPSLGVDLQWGSRWQAGIDGSIGLMSTDPDNGEAQFVNMSSVGVELRRYFSACYSSTDNRLANANGCQSHHGPYLAIDARMLRINNKMDVDIDGIGRNGYIYTAGLTLGYTFWLPGAMTIDLGLGAGYVRRDYNRYVWYAPKQQNRLLTPRIDSTFGLTHAEISLVYHFKLK